MRYSLPTLSLATTCLSQLLPPDAPGPAPKYPIGVSKAPFAKVSGRMFEIDGKVQYFAGTNAWWLAHLSNNSDIDIALKQMIDTVYVRNPQTQYKVVRVWGFGDVNQPPPANATDPNRVYFHLLNSTGTYINYGPAGLDRLDYAVSAAEALLPDPASSSTADTNKTTGLGLRLVLPLVNYWDDYGGIKAYNKAGLAADAAAWYTDAAAQRAYRAYVRAVVSRYRSSPAVFAWELANEARCEGGACGASTDIIAGWVAATAAYIKALDPAHMVTTGEEGFFERADGLGGGQSIYGGVAGTSFRRNVRDANIDYGTFHLYPSWWGYPYTWGAQWIREHDAIGDEVGKPIVLEEYGTPFPHNHTATLKPWLDAIEANSTLAADQLWQFSPRDTSVPPTSFADEFAVSILDDEYEVLCRQHAANMLNKKLKT
ncbi:uncharacterized protein E0L32_008885 [Thyridium curvatum]|uniref:mannan endo-1,4-beta-mannosidase n=1 Tax=Thyridium curvatum TaxID=1093900 RepID=A0A507AQ16_9PEZI|nr:uncharacterized protein E0L32_008885 [Thyridium curvatum]TPX09863.1 hypothetical protein E0L32_008885 [Thyridium curvatum]